MVSAELRPILKYIDDRFNAMHATAFLKSRIAISDFTVDNLKRSCEAAAEKAKSPVKVEEYTNAEKKQINNQMLREIETYDENNNKVKIISIILLVISLLMTLATYAIYYFSNNESYMDYWFHYDNFISFNSFKFIYLIITAFLLIFSIVMVGCSYSSKNISSIRHKHLSKISNNKYQVEVYQKELHESIENFKIYEKLKEEYEEEVKNNKDAHTQLEQSQNTYNYLLNNCPIRPPYNTDEYLNQLKELIMAEDITSMEGANQGYKKLLDFYNKKQSDAHVINTITNNVSATVNSQLDSIHSEMDMLNDRITDTQDQTSNMISHLYNNVDSLNRNVDDINRRMKQ